MLYINIIFFLKVDQLWSKLANLRSYFTKELKKVNDSKKVVQGQMKSIKVLGATLKVCMVFFGHK